MNTKTLVIAAVVIAATASLALAPTFTSIAMADAGGINHRETTHKGEGGDCTGDNPHGKNCVTSCKVMGEVKTPCPDT